MFKPKHRLNEKKISYKFKNLVGGFSDGVSVAATESPGSVKVSVNIYGGGQDTSGLRYRVPTKIANYQAAYIKTANGTEPITNDVANQLETYKKDIKEAVSVRLYPILQEFDDKCRVAIGQAMAEVNKKYGGTPPAPQQPKQTQAPKPMPKPTQQIKKPQVQQQTQVAQKPTAPKQGGL